MSWKILATSSAFARTGESAAQRLTETGCKILSASESDTAAPDALLNLLKGIDAVLAGNEKYTATILGHPQAAQLKIISRWGVGFDAIDLSAAAENGIVVANTPGLLDEAVADYTFALLLVLARRVHEGHGAMCAGEWTQFWGNDVHGKILGLIGCGRIGLAVAKRAKGFNLRVLAFDPSPGEEAKKLGVHFVPLDTLLAESDFVSLHAALTPQNRGLMNAGHFRKMKPGARFINAARGAMVDEAALVCALREGWIAGAAIDVFGTEPLPLDSLLRTAPNLLLSPHQSSYGRETGQRVSLAAAQAILDLMSGLRPQSVVNADVLQSANLRAPIRI